MPDGIMSGFIDEVLSAHWMHDLFSLLQELCWVSKDTILICVPNSRFLPRGLAVLVQRLGVGPRDGRRQELIRGKVYGLVQISKVLIFWHQWGMTNGLSTQAIGQEIFQARMNLRLESQRQHCFGDTGCHALGQQGWIFSLGGRGIDHSSTLSIWGP